MLPAIDRDKTTMLFYSGKVRLAVRWAMFVLLLALLALPLSALFAQENGVTTITLSLPPFVDTIVTPDLLAQFEADNPDVKVQTVSGSFPIFPLPSAGLDDHLSAVEKYVSAADVVYMGSNNLSVEATRAGYFLDLTPLTSADAALNVDDFFPDVWQSVQWDGGIWMMPVSADVVTLIYNKDDFDKAGLAYPNGQWTVDDLDKAARALAEKDANGSVTKPGLGMFGDYTGLLVRSLTGEGFYDSSVVPNAPLFSKPALEPILTTLAQLEKDGVMTSGGFTAQITDVPMRIMGSIGLSALLNNQSKPGGTLLPGGKAGLDAQGFAISAGTQYPEQAYALVKFLSLRPETGNNFLSATPARKSLVGVQGASPQGGTGAAIAAIRPSSPEDKAVIDEALANALPTSEMRFGDYLAKAIATMNKENVDAHTALQEVEAQATSNMQAAANKHDNLVVNVATPVPETAVASGKISLKFGMLSFVNPLPNKDQWDRVIQDFVASDPQVGEVAMDTGLNQPADSAKKFDCFYLPLNYVPQIDLTTILNLDPFIDADPTFDRNDLAGSVLVQVQRDNKVWALPIALQPEGLKYDSDQFNRAGVPAPDNGWAIDAFNDALKTLKPTPQDKPPFESRGIGGTYLLLLTAAYGGLPIDYRTNPPTINFTDAATVNAIQQVLDLAKNGYLKYDQLASNSIISFGGLGSQELSAIYTQSLNGFGFGARVGGAAQNDPYRLTMYPKGNQFNGATYSIDTAYISATSQNAEACYRWLSTLSRHPELFSGMPARRSFLGDPAVTATQKPDETAFYKQFDALLQDPNTIAFPSLLSGGSPSTYLVERWLDKAFDDYVLHDGDLSGDLATAETYAKGFLECTANIPPYDPATEQQLAYLKQYTDCAAKVDPSSKSLLPIGG
jgi:ABC-type glycerol-3-phosphate transport system substrate-binding protein